jgi:hypothetical protein
MGLCDRQEQDGHCSLAVAALLRLRRAGALQILLIASAAERDRLSKNLQTSLDRMSQDCDQNSPRPWWPLPVTAQTDADLFRAPVRYEQWRKSSRQANPQPHRLAEPQNGHVMPH